MNNIIYKTPADIFNNVDFEHYILKYSGKVQDGKINGEEIYITPINDSYGILSVKEGSESQSESISFIKSFKLDKSKDTNGSIIYVKTSEYYVLQEVTPIEASQVEVVQSDSSLNLTGNKTLVGIVDTGIDYLSEEFINEDGKTRIGNIWDQTINTDNNNEIRDVPFGTVYDRNKINKGIELFKSGGNPYTIVPSQDDIGHGTKMAGIIGASGKNPKVKGVAPKCEFAIVKLNEAIRFKRDYDIKIPIYNITSIFMAIEYLIEYSSKINKPMIIFLPLGTNSGNHKGEGILQQYIESVSNKLGMAVVSGSGNEGENQGHTSGNIPNVGLKDSFDIDVGQEQKFISLEVWINRPDVMTIEIISPSGENTGVVPLLINSKEDFVFVFEQTRVIVNYLMPEEITGDELILVYFLNLKPGRWKIRLTSTQFNKGLYNAWIPQKGITIGDTKLIPSDPYGTISIPGDSRDVITVAAYNQKNNNVLDYSGVSLRNISLDQIDVAAGGEGAITIAPNNEVVSVSGTSVSAAVVAGVCLLLLQWGIVDGYNPYIFSETLRSYLIRGTVKRYGDIYPNPEWGYGILNVFGIFENIR